MLPTQFQDPVVRRYEGDGRHRFQRISLQVRNLLRQLGLLEMWTKDSRV
jgi:hypothetical protein